MNKILMMRLILLLFFCFSAFVNYAQSCTSFPGAFTLSTPSASQILSAQVNLSWGNSSNAEEYRVYYKRSNVTAFTGGPTVTTTSAVLTGLIPGAQYNIKIESSFMCEGAEPMPKTRDSNTVTITMDALGTPTGLTNTNVQQTTITADWDNVEGATGYSVEMYSGAILIYSSTSTISEKAISDSDIVPGNTYSWRVKATGAGSTQSSFSAGHSVLMRPANPSGLLSTSHSANGFTATWNDVVGETNYRLDVSTSSTFTSFVLNNVSVSANNTSRAVTSLAPGATYYYRVRSENGSGVSGNSTTANTITVPPAPVLQSLQNITQTSFTARWATTAGASSYHLDVSLDDFASILFGYNNLTVTTTSRVVEGLVPGTVYKYRVRAVNNSGTSLNSTIGEITTVPPEPDIEPASNLTMNSFTANWSDVNGESAYRLDVSEESNFQSFVSGYQNFSVAGTSQQVAGLQPGTEYYYRIRAENANGVSGNSGTMNLITVPEPPVASEATEILTTSFIANWEASEGAVSYRLDVSSNDFVTLQTGYNNLSTTETFHFVEGLSVGVVYKYRVRAVNGGGISANSNEIGLITKPDVVLALSPSEITQTTFKANWSSLANVLGYQLDVSSDNFITFLTDYSSKPVTENFEALTGLEPGVTYQYRLRSVNESGVSENSNTVNVLLAPANPTALEVVKQSADIGATFFKASWNAVQTTTAYRLDVSLNEDFNDFVPTYQNRFIDPSLTSVMIEGLSAGTTYFFRLKAVNSSGASNFSNVIKVETIPDAPVVNEPVDITANSFTISWNAPASATEYFIDVATNSTFTNFVVGFQNSRLTNTAVNVTGLSAGSVYYARVKSSNASGISTSSAVVEQVTVPLPVLAQNITERDKTSTTITINWPHITGAVFYDVQVAADQEFANPLEEYNTRRIEELNELVIEGLDPQTSFFVRIKSGNSAGISAFSNIKIITTLGTDDGGGGDGGIAELLFGSPVFNSIFTTGNQVQIALTGSVGQKTVLFHHRGITQTEFETEVITSATNTQSIMINDTWLDVLGMEFFFTATDEAEQLVTTARHLIKQNVAGAVIPVPATGGTLKDYRIIALPYQVENDVIENILEPEFGAYNPARWRLLRYQNGKNVDYSEGLSKLRMERGQGFWLNTMEGAMVNLRSPEITFNSQDAPFILPLQAGWNQIGNPYPFALDWGAVIQHNGNPEGVGSLLTYQAEQISLAENTVLQMYEGGFIYADEDINLTVPVTLGIGSQSSARMLTEQVSPSDEAWFIPITLIQGELHSSLGGIGMNVEAKGGLDKFDLPVVPRFIRFLEWKTKHTLSDLVLTRDVVNMQDTYQWSVELSHNSHEPITLQWNAQQLDGKSLILIDEQTKVLIDMIKKNEYTFQGGSRTFTIYYKNGQTELDEVMQMGVAYPNPANENVTIISGFTTQNGSLDTKLLIRSATGRVVTSLNYTMQQEGLQKIEWNLKDSSGQHVLPGVYFYELVSSDLNTQTHFNGKLIIK